LINSSENVSGRLLFHFSPDTLQLLEDLGLAALELVRAVLGQRAVGARLLVPGVRGLTARVGTLPAFRANIVTVPPRFSLVVL
jgi:hypothetical protein